MATPKTPVGASSERTVRFNAAQPERGTGSERSSTAVTRGAGSTILSKLLFRTRSIKKAQEAEGAVGEEDTEAGDIFDSAGSRKTRTRKKAGKSKGTVLAELQAEEEQRQRELQESLTVSERGYLPVHVRTKLLELNALPPTPYTEGSRGVVLFADISGFTNLGKELRGQMTALEAASKLANRICIVLKELTDICHEFEGDVAKFAGDALLCVWEHHEDQWMLERAKACAVTMLNRIKTLDSQLDLHGGIAMGNILHFHLGDQRQELLWYLVTGDAVVRAANLVDEAPRGQILYEPRRAESLAGIGDEIQNSESSVFTPPSPSELTRLPSVLNYECITKDTKTMIVPTHKRQKSRDDDEMPLSSPGDALGQGRRLSMEHRDDNDGETNGAGISRSRTSTEDDPFLNMRITPKGRSYIPRALKNILMSGRIESGEMRNGVVILFAALPSLVLGEQEIVANKVTDGRRRLLNETFSHVSTILRQMDGAFRDLLFDDKGCIFIAVFGAYGAIEMPELKALKAAERMREELEVEDLKIGISVGTCFVGLVGNDVRHDMIVMGHEVNMSARLMSKAPEGNILVSSKIRAATRDFFDFESVTVELKKHALPGDLSHNVSARRFASHENDLTGDGEKARRDSEAATSDPNGRVTAYRPMKEKPQLGVNMSSYRYTQVIPEDYFVGRKTELQKLQGHMTKASKEKAGSMCIVSGPRGYGKTWLIREFQHKSDDKYDSMFGVAFELYVMTPLYVFRQMFERMFDMSDGMPAKSARLVMARWKEANIKLDPVVVEKLFPYMSKFLPQSRRVSTIGGRGIVGKIMGSIRLTSPPVLEEDENGSQATAASKQQGSGPLQGSGSGLLTLTGSGIIRKLPNGDSAERASSGGMLPLAPPSGANSNTLVEEIRQSSSNAVPLVRSASSLQNQASPKMDPMTVAAAAALDSDGKRRMISTRNLLLDSSKKNQGSSKTLLLDTAMSNSQVLPPMMMSTTPTPTTATVNNPSATSGGSPLLGAHASSPVIGPQKIAVEDLKKKKQQLVRKQSRGDMALVMGQKEIDPMVKFITSLFELACSETAKRGKKGLIVVLEDVQWLDAVSLQILNDLMEKMIANPKVFLPSVYFIASCRDADPDKKSDSPMAMAGKSSDMRSLLEQRFLERSRDFKTFNLIELDVLQRDEVDSLMTSLLVNEKNGSTVSKEILDLVFNNSGGMANAVADIFELIKRNDGAVYLDPHTNQWRWKTISKDGKHDGGQSVLREARQAFVLRVDNLSLATRDLLKIAACLCDSKTQKFRLHDIEDVIKLDLETKSRYLRADTHVPSVEYIGNKLQEAVSSGLLKYRKAWVSSVEDWAFGSSAMAETVLDMVPSDRLKQIRGMKKDIEKEKTGAAAEGLFRDFLGAV